MPRDGCYNTTQQLINVLQKQESLYVREMTQELSELRIKYANAIKHIEEMVAINAAAEKVITASCTVYIESPHDNEDYEKAREEYYVLTGII